MSRRLDALLYHGADARIGMIRQRANFALDDLRLVRGEARDDEIRARREHPLSDRDELIGGLALAEYHFRNPAPDAPMVVQLGKTEIFERQLADMLERRRRSHAAGGDAVEDLADSLFSHRRLSSSGRIGCARVNMISRTARASLRVTVIVKSPSVNFSPGLGMCPSRSTTRPPIVAYSSASESLRPKRSFSSAIGARPTTDSTRGLTIFASSSPRSCSSSISPTISSIS